MEDYLIPAVIVAIVFIFVISGLVGIVFFSGFSPACWYSLGAMFVVAFILMILSGAP